ncbi:hypothetical protein, partial [Klebsiella pneumoniae]|uniref:hypothetical protein n=1 Tax=Klebsiella pneumoniae TaxID=573 RepID=UPI001D0DE88D
DIPYIKTKRLTSEDGSRCAFMHRPRLPARSHLQQPKYIAMGFGYCPATGCGIARIVMTINRQGSYSPLHVTKYVTGRFSS